MPEIQIKDFSAGWTPGDDPYKGRKNGLLQMDNVELDSNGALTLAGGTLVKQSGYPGNAHTLFSRLINGARADYALLSDGSGYRNNTSLFANGGDATNGAFGTAFNFTLIASGNRRYKDSGTGIVNLGINPPTAAPTLVYSTSNSPRGGISGEIAILANLKTPVGSSAIIGGLYLQGTADVNGNYTVQSYNVPVANANLLQGIVLGGVSNLGYATDNDYIQFIGYTPIVAGRSIRFDVLLSPGDSAGNQVADYYTYTIDDLSQLNFIATFGTWFIRMRRKDFVRVGSGPQDWSTTYGFRITYTGGASGEVVNILGNNLAGEFFCIVGGTHAQNGQYQYLQINVNNTGSYLAKSSYGPLSNLITLDMGQSLITPQNPAAVDAQANEVWIYRRGALLGGDWYRVKVFTNATGYGAAYDTLGDEEALTLNQKLNINLVSIASGSITDKIFDIIGPVNGRWYYFTTNFMYPSEINNPDLVDVSIAIRLTGSSSELFMWARQLDDSTILVGTSVDVYTLRGTFATFPDSTIDIYYRPIHCKYPPLTCDAEVWGGSVYYMANDGWRLLDGSGNNPSLVSPNLDRLYRGETVQGYAPPVLKVIPRSVRFPIVIAKNKMFCFITGIANPRIEVYDFIRQHWRAVNYGLGDFSAAVHTQDGQVLVFFTFDKKLREIDIQSSRLIDGATKQVFNIKTMVHDGDTQRQRKDSSTLKINSQTVDNFNIYLIVNDSGAFNLVGNAVNTGMQNDQIFDLSVIPAVALVKTYQTVISGTVGSVTLADLVINYDLRPEQRNFIRVQSNNYGVVGRKRFYSIPFQIDTLGNNVTLVPILDGAPQTGLVVNSILKKSFDYKFSLSGIDIPKAVDYEYTLHSNGLFEFFGFGEPKDIEVYPEPQLAYIIPVSNFNSAAKKRVRVWPFVLSSPTAGNSITFTPLVDGVTTPGTVFNVGIEKQTFRHYFKTDVFGVDYSGIFSSLSPFEINNILAPEIVQILPIAKQFDQVGPEEFFRYGQIKQIELRILAFGTSIPYTIYFNDTTSNTGAFNTTNGKENTYFIMLPKGVSGHIVRIELGPTAFDFHRFYTRLQVSRYGKESELEWINL